MKIQEAVENMSKRYLGRIVDSFTEDLPAKDEEEARKQIIDYSSDLGDIERINKKLEVKGKRFHERLLQQFVIESLLNQEEVKATEREIYQRVINDEENIFEKSKKDICFQYSDDRSIDILRTVLEVAVEDNKLADREIALIDGLRNKLNLNIQDQYLLLSRLNHFPRSENRIHTSDEIDACLLELQKAGVVFCCNKHPGGKVFVIPEELQEGVKEAVGFELSKKGFDLLLENFTVKQLRKVLRENSVPKNGTKSELIYRILHLNLSPSEVLEYLQSSELSDLLRELPGAKVSGRKEEKIQEIINYYEDLKISKKQHEEDTRELFYEFYEELANRDNKNLRANKVIDKDRDIDGMFEEATRYLFEEILEVELIEFDGSEHPDGCFELGNKGLLMWDNKSKEGEYTFPNSHRKQFARYIREESQRVACFLIITSDIDESARGNMYDLKQRSPDDTDVALITGEDLKWLAETWLEECEGEKFNPDILNITDILDRQKLKARLNSFQ